MWAESPHLQSVMSKFMGCVPLIFITRLQDFGSMYSCSSSNLLCATICHLSSTENLFSGHTSFLAHNSNKPCVFRFSGVYSEVRVLIKGAHFGPACWYTTIFPPFVISCQIMSFSEGIPSACILWLLIPYPMLTSLLHRSKQRNPFGILPVFIVCIMII